MKTHQNHFYFASVIFDNELFGKGSRWEGRVRKQFQSSVCQKASVLEPLFHIGAFLGTSLGQDGAVGAWMKFLGRVLSVPSSVLQQPLQC